MAEPRGESTGVRPDRSGAPDWARKYPPLVSILLALILAIAVLPSALNLPQTNPTQTLEYAPVPPEDDEDPPPAQGNLSSFGLGSSSGLAADAEGGEGPGGTLPPLPELGKGNNPSTKRCVGSPPRQTEDPVSPPCVAFFNGDNFGKTYQGVTGEEIRLLIYMNGNLNYVDGSKRRDISPTSTYFDLFQPPQPDEHFIVTGFRGWQRYFNDRYQTYGRTVHFYVYFDGGVSASSPENRRADAADNFAKIKPFAVLTDVVFGGNEVDYVEAMARRGVLNFGTLSGHSSAFFRKFPKLIWGYLPTVEYQAETYASYVCQKVVNQPAVLAGGEFANRPRKLGMLYTADENWPGLILAAELVKQKVEACGGEIEAEATFPECCFASDPTRNPDYAARNMADFRERGITTILWTGGIEGWTAATAAGQGYFPEWIVLGDEYLSGNNANRHARTGPAFDERSIVITPQVFHPGQDQQRCIQAYREADRAMPKADLTFVCIYYRNLVQLFTGIQVAGPRLGPSSVDKGYHAIPPVASKDKQAPSCFYEPGDYTCIKDAQLETWDDQAMADGDNRPGCWRILADSARYFKGKFPPGNINSEFATKGVCNGFTTGAPRRGV